jgi:spermine synthase
VNPSELESTTYVDETQKQILTLLAKYFQSEASSISNVVSNQIIPSDAKHKNSTGILSVYLGPSGCVITIRMYKDTGLVTINIEYYKNSNEEPLLTFENCQELEKAWSAWAQTVKPVKTLAALKRGLKIDTYFYSSEYDMDKILYDKRSPFQHIQIIHSVNFGNLLVLDDFQNLAESDLVYTESIMRRGVENYAGKEILILGGGDGALLHELRKENPKMVTMIEIDDMVMQACKIHLRSACGDTLDNYKGENYEIIVGDCVAYMEKCYDAKKYFDYVFADLTDIPISTAPEGELWDFIRKILNASFNIIRKTGKYMTHGNGSSSPAALKMYENVLGTLQHRVTFTKTHAFVPSFMEDWVFYQVQRDGHV